jgi:hypothetical protein
MINDFNTEIKMGTATIPAAVAFLTHKQKRSCSVFAWPGGFDLEAIQSTLEMVELLTKFRDRLRERTRLGNF